MILRLLSWKCMISLTQDVEQMLKYDW
jgi:hypothetical protein